MLENCKTAKERWGGVNAIVDRWLQERQELLVGYCALSELTEFDENNAEHSQKFRRFCQTMMDYVSAGHFEVYDQLIKEGKDFGDKSALEAAALLYKMIDSTTEHILDFNDKYQETDDLASLANDLSDVGQQLESRFEAEDQMISVLHDAHKEMLA
ncbi:MAG: regulator of sigma D [Cellvibrionaceae bacterium]|jgi:regulator of sigma D